MPPHRRIPLVVYNPNPDSDSDDSEPETRPFHRSSLPPFYTDSQHASVLKELSIQSPVSPVAHNYRSGSGSSARSSPAPDTTPPPSTPGQPLPPPNVQYHNLDQSTSQSKPSLVERAMNHLPYPFHSRASSHPPPVSHPSLSFHFSAHVLIRAYPSLPPPKRSCHRPRRTSKFWPVWTQTHGEQSI